MMSKLKDRPINCQSLAKISGLGLFVGYLCLILVCDSASAQRQSDSGNQSGNRPDRRQVTQTDLQINRATAGQARYEDGTFIVPISVEISNSGRGTTVAIVAQANYYTPGQRPVSAWIMNHDKASSLVGLATGGRGTLTGELRISDRRAELSGQKLIISIQLDPSNAIADSNRRNNVSAPFEVVLPNTANSRRPNRPDRLPQRPNQLPVVPPLTSGTPQGPTGNGLGTGAMGGVSNGEGNNHPAAGSGQSGPQGLVSNKVLADVYRANDGGAYYVHQLENKVYMFGEHPGLGYAVVFEGSLNGQKIDGHYWDVPKGKRANRGSLQLEIQNSGNRLVVRQATGGFGISVLEPYAIQNHQLPRADRKPGFYTTKADDLDGAWRAGSSHLYIREVDGKVIGWLESQFTNGNKPTNAMVLIGSRTTATQVVFKQITVPKGVNKGSNQSTFIVNDAFHIRQLGGSTFVKDVLDFDKFGDEIFKAFKNGCVGFGYAIAHEGVIVKSGGWGNRLLSMDGGPLPFDANTQKCTQSTSKTITAAAVMHLLHSKGLSVDTKIVDYLPNYWEKGPMTEHLTFAHLLRHRSGLSDFGDPDEYANLRKTIKTGPSNMNWISPQFEYRNSNYALFRIIIPYLDKPGDMHNFESNGLRGDSINERCSTRYFHYVRDNVLIPAGVSNVQANYTSPNRAYSYNYVNQNVAGYPQQSGQLYEMGAGSWVMSANDYVKFLAGLENGKILPKEQVAEMKSKGLGLYTISSSIGTAYMHGGSIGGNNSDSYGHGRGARAHSMMFPNNVQLFITINSANNLGPAETSSARAAALRDAFNAAFHD
ncbi:MAG TPA: serine hydrolase domain-containing protein [Pirellulaceae bacterium]|nr:serine hydrolase domain-containing protein [Pirellulaceae bacterium]HMO93427.1 serine hydrolase domain-containing protein [Pirellulaceae bacterium]HMP71402.1 serine hydrolase domain-containing protein [Pirellulaceae bacterium]